MKEDIDESKPYIIAETAYNHEGDIAYLLKMIDDIAEMGLNTVKLHLLLNPESYFEEKHPLMNEIQKWLFDQNQWDEIFDYSSEKGLDVIALCDDVESVHYVTTKSNVSAIEIHASGLNDYFLLTALSSWDRRIMLGIGGSSMDEIQYAVQLLNTQEKKDIILMYGFQAYPTNYQDINLTKMIKIQNLFGLAMGYADHTSFDDPNNEFISVIPAAMGFHILEKHYTPDPGVERIDFHSAVGKEQMLRIKKLLQLISILRGTGQIQVSPPELEYGNVGPMKKAIVARKLIKEGEKLSLDNLWFKRTVKESTLQQCQFAQLLGLEATRDIKQGELIAFSQVRYSFKIPKVESFTHLEE